MLLQADALRDKDELLGTSVTDALISEAEEYLRAAAAGLGVACARATRGLRHGGAAVLTMRTATPASTVSIEMK